MVLRSVFAQEKINLFEFEFAECLNRNFKNFRKFTELTFWWYLKLFTANCVELIIFFYNKFVLIINSGNS